MHAPLLLSIIIRFEQLEAFVDRQWQVRHQRGERPHDTILVRVAHHGGHAFTMRHEYFWPPKHNSEGLVANGRVGVAEQRSNAHRIGVDCFELQRVRTHGIEGGLARSSLGGRNWSLTTRRIGRQHCRPSTTDAGERADEKQT